jgi:hypothetical protein
MADISDVGQALVDFIESVVYPNGVQQPSIIGNGIKTYQGWPTPEELEDDLAAGIVHVSVFARPGGRVIDTLTDDWEELAPPVNGVGIAVKELRREAHVFQISVWAQSYSLRDQLAKPLDAAFAKMWRMPLSDGTTGMVRYVSSTQIDDLQKQGIYKRDLLYEVAYGITDEQQTTAVSTPVINTTTGN